MNTVHEQVARDVLDNLLHVHQVLGEPLSAADAPESWDAETRQLLRTVASAVGTMYTDLMIPIIGQHPALDPDREGAPVRTTTQVVAATAFDGVSARESIAQSVVRACEKALELLEQHRDVLLGGRSRDATMCLGELAQASKRELLGARQLAMRLGSRKPGAP